jgi:hypothetical protein
MRLSLLVRRLRAEGLCVVGKFVGKKLQGDVATELQVFHFVDYPSHHRKCCGGCCNGKPSAPSGWEGVDTGENIAGDERGGNDWADFAKRFERGKLTFTDDVLVISVVGRQ